MLALEPCLFHYFLFLIKDKGKLNQDPINESQYLWDKLCNIFDIEKTDLQLLESLKKNNKNIYFDKRVKRLAMVKSEDNMLLSEQILAHDMLVICVVCNSPKDHGTDTPEIDWETQLEITTLSTELAHIYDTATVLQAITDEPQQVAEHVQGRVPLFKDTRVSTCVFKFGILHRFGQRNHYLLTIDRETEGAANKFLANNFAYITTLLSKINTHYLLAVKLYESITDQETLVKHLKEDLSDMSTRTDLQLLEHTREESRAITTEATDNLAYLRDCGNNIQSNIVNLRDAIKEFVDNRKEDKIFLNDLELFEEHVQNIDSWVTVCESALMRINRTAGEIQFDLNEVIERIRSKKVREEAATVTDESSKTIVQAQASIHWGCSYIFDENELNQSIEIFKEIVDLNNPGICISRTHPDILKRPYGLDNAMLYWLGQSSEDFSIPPILEKLTNRISTYFKEHKNSVLLFDGLEYIKTYNDFNKIVKFVDHLKDLIVMYNNILLIPVNFKTFHAEEIASLKKNIIDLTDAEIDVQTVRTLEK